MLIHKCKHASHINTMCYLFIFLRSPFLQWNMLWNVCLQQEKPIQAVLQCIYCKVTASIFISYKMDANDPEPNKMHPLKSSNKRRRMHHIGPMLLSVQSATCKSMFHGILKELYYCVQSLCATLTHAVCNAACSMLRACQITCGGNSGPLVQLHLPWYWEAHSQFGESFNSRFTHTVSSGFITWKLSPWLEPKWQKMQRLSWAAEMRMSIILFLTTP